MLAAIRELMIKAFEEAARFLYLPVVSYFLARSVARTPFRLAVSGAFR
jgi:hypothetical protein